MGEEMFFFGAVASSSTNFAGVDVQAVLALLREADEKGHYVVLRD